MKFQTQLFLLNAFLIFVCVFTLVGTWSFQTNPFISMLGTVRWLVLALSVAFAIFAIVTLKDLSLRAPAALESIPTISWFALIISIINLFIFFAVKSFTIDGLVIIILMVLSVAALLIVRAKNFIQEYTSSN